MVMVSKFVCQHAVLLHILRRNPLYNVRYIVFILILNIYLGKVPGIL